MECRKVFSSRHVVIHMFERSITRADILEVPRTGEVIEQYPEDSPFPSFLMLGFSEHHPLHVVVAVDSETGTCYIITAYDPDAEVWERDFRTRTPR